MAKVNCASVRILFQGIIKKKLSFFLQRGTCPIIDVGLLLQYVCYQFRKAEDIFP